MTVVRLSLVFFKGRYYAEAFCVFRGDFCWYRYSSRLGLRTGPEPASQPCSERKLRFRRRQNRDRGLFEPAREGPQDLRWFGSLWQSMARRGERNTEDWNGY